MAQAAHHSLCFALLRDARRPSAPRSMGMRPPSLSLCFALLCFGLSLSLSLCFGFRTDSIQGSLASSAASAGLGTLKLNCSTSHHESLLESKTLLFIHYAWKRSLFQADNDAEDRSCLWRKMCLEQCIVSHAGVFLRHKTVVSVHQHVSRFEIFHEIDGSIVF